MAKRGVGRRKPLQVRLSWVKFRERMLDYATLNVGRRSQLLFRGHSSASFPLASTLDRDVEFADEAAREQFIQRMILELKSELIHLADTSSQVPDGVALELLARHHGLPSPLIDWTRSPWIAAYFAFRSVPDDVERVAVWRLDRARIGDTEAVDFVDDPDFLRFNRRGLMQRGVFVRVNNVRRPLEDVLAPALIKYVIPSKERRTVLADLDEMGINATRLFADTSGACMTIWDRMNDLIEEPDDES